MSPLLHRRRAGQALLGLACAVTASVASAQPALAVRGLSADVAAPGTVIEIRMDAMKVDSIEWDPDTSRARSLPRSTTGAVFSVPRDARPGEHKVVVTADGRSSPPIPLRVAGRERQMAPRIDGITLSSARFAGGRIRAVLMVHAANPDVGASLLVDGQPVTAQLSRVLFAGRPKPESYQYPISHFGTLWAEIDRPLGSTMSVVVVNENDLRSNERGLQLPSLSEDLDSDGDGIPDQIEIQGIDSNGDGIRELDLAAMGASPLRKDLFVEVDWMQGARHQATERTWQIVQQAFERMPILNSDGSIGVRVWIDRGQGGAFTGGGTLLADRNCISLGNHNTANIVGTEVIKANPAHFAPARAGVFHYGVLGHQGFETETASGCGFRTSRRNDKRSGSGEILGDDFYISCPPCGERAMASVVFHELGHNLGLLHGGHEDLNLKPSYPSTMNYLYQWPGVDVDCDLRGDGIDSFSWGMLASLDEGRLRESEGVCESKFYDWNANGDTDSGTVAVHLTKGKAYRVLTDHADIGALRFDFRPRPSHVSAGGP
ncbi:MAG TPA: hypothetical protein VEU33_19150 [Archangium sp.]|nr:hypothetical protein [Archangium sp.]